MYIKRYTIMVKESKTSKIDQYPYANIVSLNQNVLDRRFLVFDLWEETKKESTQDKFKQIFFQIDELNILGMTNGAIHFDLTKRSEVIQSINSIEDHILEILKRYLAKINKKGKFSFCSVVKNNVNDATGKNVGNMILALNINNDDYPLSIYNRNGNKTDISILKSGSKVSIIVEITNLYLDMVEGKIVIDTRLRMIKENSIKPKRVQLSNVDIFSDVIEKDEQCETTVSEIQNSFDVTKTEMYRESDQDIDQTPNEIKHTEIPKKETNHPMHMQQQDDKIESDQNVFGESDHNLSSEIEDCDQKQIHNTEAETESVEDCDEKDYDDNDTSDFCEDSDREIEEENKNQDVDDVNEEDDEEDNENDDENNEDKDEDEDYDILGKVNKIIQESEQNIMSDNSNVDIDVDSDDEISDIVESLINYNKNKSNKNKNTPIKKNQVKNKSNK